MLCSSRTSEMLIRTLFSIPAMLNRLPPYSGIRLSATVTDAPRSTSRRASEEPMKPRPPVMITCFPRNSSVMMDFLTRMLWSVSPRRTDRLAQSTRSFLCNSQGMPGLPCAGRRNAGHVPQPAAPCGLSSCRRQAIDREQPPWPESLWEAQAIRWIREQPAQVFHRQRWPPQVYRMPLLQEQYSGKYPPVRRARKYRRLDKTWPIERSRG